MKNNHPDITTLNHVDDNKTSFLKKPPPTLIDESSKNMLTTITTTNNIDKMDSYPLDTVNDQPIDDNVEEDHLFVLIPFNHQVGGHTQMMLLNQSTLCKPLVPRELMFYMNIPPPLIDFVPKYKGVVEIRQNESQIPTLYHPSTTDYESKPELRVRLSTCNDRGLLESTTVRTVRDQQQSLGISSRPIQRYFMLLENIACKYHLPCVLDLKMGTRQHSDDASDEKRNRQMAKCAASTSASLGVRICGMQVYHKISNTNNYRVYHRDKYHGRRIKDEDGLKNELEIYFKNRTYLIKPILSRLKKLKAKVIETLRTTSLRFISTSLLIVSEGCMDSHHSRFNSKHSNSDGEDNYDYEFEDEDDYLDSEEEDHVEINEKVDPDHHHHHPLIHVDEDSSCSFDSIHSNQSEKSIPAIVDHHNGSSNDDDQQIPFETVQCNRDHHRHIIRSLSSNEPEFDIRLIDFAHTSFSQTSSSTSSTQPSSSDYGFILGIENLIRLLNEILMDKIRQPTSSLINLTNKRRRSSSINSDNYHRLVIGNESSSNKKLLQKKSDKYLNDDED